jgi:hypothetical protein
MLYGPLQEPNVVTDSNFQLANAVVCGTGVFLFLQYFQKMSFEKAIGWSTLPYVYQAIFKLVTNKHQALGVPKEVYPPLILNLLIFFAAMTEASFATNLNKFYGIFSLVNAVPMIFAPDMAAKAWKLTIKTPFERLSIETLGASLFYHGLAVCLQAFGKTDLMDTLGWVALSASTIMAGQVLAKRPEKGGILSGPILVWVVALGVIGYSYLL